MNLDRFQSKLGTLEPSVSGDAMSIKAWLGFSTSDQTVSGASFSCRLFLLDPAHLGGKPFCLHGKQQPGDGRLSSAEIGGNRQLHSAKDSLLEPASSKTTKDKVFLCFDYKRRISIAGK